MIDIITATKADIDNLMSSLTEQYVSRKNYEKRLP